MDQLSPVYFKLAAEQLTLIGIFLGGVSTSILGTLITHKDKSKVFKLMILGLSLAAVSFIISVFGMIKIQMILAPDSPYQHKEGLLFYPKIVSAFALLLGIYSLLSVISLSGWMISKRIGMVTTLIGIISGIIIFTLT